MRKAIEFPLRNLDRHLTQTNLIKAETMLTQDTILLTPSVRLEHSHEGIQVFIADTLIGAIDEQPVWGLDTGYDAALSQGLIATDECYVFGGFPYRYLESAIGAVKGAYLEQTSTDIIPDCIQKLHS
jgi:hypothetical protein